ncbi:MAG TPA: enoyl-CoA hydratase/isomerase family protein [candidate division Zixibacteria bacterium]|nr:enoyl-CoA hydratase/isomerase family protein [candidate division Zixibacteria bacterium]
MQPYQNWIIEEDDHVARLSLNRSRFGDNLDSETLYELGDISEMLQSRADIWSIVVQSKGKHFSTGFDPELIRSKLSDSEASIRDLITSHHRCLNLFENIEKPTIAAVRGFCIGGGILLALCCDLRVASERTVFSLSEIRLGIPILWGTHRLVRVVGAARAKQMILLGDRFRARQAKEYGLVHQVVRDEDLDSAVDVLVSKLSKSPPRTLGYAKRLINKSSDPTIGGTEELELDAITELRSSPDVSEAISCYFEGRIPQYTGE